MSRSLVSQRVVLGVVLLLSAGLACRTLAAGEGPKGGKAEAKALKEIAKGTAKPHGPLLLAKPAESEHPQLHKPVLRALHSNEENPFADTPAKPAGRKNAPAGKPHAPATPATGEEAIERALAQPTEIDFFETSLSDAIAFLQDSHHIQIMIDNKALEELGVATDAPLTRKLRGVPLRSALDLILREVGLAYTIHCEVLLITSPETVQSADLMMTEVYEVDDLVVCRDEKGQLWDDYDTLEKLVRLHVAAETWADVGGAGTVTGISVGGAKLLVVTQSYPMQFQLRRFLEDLRKHAAKAGPDKKPPLRTRPANASGMHGMSGTGGMGGMGGMSVPPGGKGSTGFFSTGTGGMAGGRGGKRAGGATGAKPPRGNP